MAREGDRTTYRWLRRGQKLEPFLGFALFALALWAIHGELGRLHVDEVVAALEAIPDTRIVAALALTGLSFLVLGGYDALGLRFAGHPLPWRRSGFASSLGYAFSQALGFPLLTGAPIRFRLYSAWGISPGEFRDLVIFYTVTFWLGLLALAGVVLVLEPGRFPPGPAVARGLGAVLLVTAVAYPAWAARRHGRGIRVGAWTIPTPGPRIAIAQLAVGMADWAVASSVLYVLLPPGEAPSWAAFLAVFLMAQLAGVLSHVPGGLGVFEAVVLTAAPAGTSPTTLAASFLVYRLVYYLLPLLMAVAALGVYEVRHRRGAIARASDAFARSVSTVVPQAMAISVFVAGLILLFSGATPSDSGRLRWLALLVPLPVIEVSHFLASVAGGGLLILARSLQRRLDAAYHLTLVLLAGGVAFSLLKGLDYEEATVLALMLAALVASRGEFHRRASLLADRFTTGWALAVLGALAAAVVLGLMAYHQVVYTGDLWWRFALDADAPRFLRASVGALAAVLAFGAARLLAPAEPEGVEPTEVALERAASIAERSPHSYARLALLGDKSFLFGRDAFLMYAVEGRSWISLGDPVGPEPERAELAWTFRERADRHGDWAVFYQVRPENLPLYLDLGLAPTKLGEEARVPLDGFSLEGGARKGQRRVLRKLQEAGVGFRMLEPGEVAPALPALKAVSDAWLAHKNTREKGFSLGSFREDYVRRTPVAIAELDGRVIAFANVLAGAGREELTVDLMRYDPSAPPGVMEYLFLELMLRGREEGYHWFNLGMAPLSGLEDRPFAPLTSRLGATLFRHGEHFYHFRGLRDYKEKFDPVWEPRYLASPGGLALPRVLANIASLISGGLRGVVTR